MFPTVRSTYPGPGCTGPASSLPRAGRGERLIPRRPAPHPVSEAQWQSQRRDAWESWSNASRERAERDGRPFFDFRVWLAGYAAAVARHRRALEAERRGKGDAEIKRAAAELVGSLCPGVRGDASFPDGYKMTPKRAQVIFAVVDAVASSGRLYASYAGLAAMAGVSQRTACSVRSELERLGVLVRVRTGGKGADGRGQSNKYTVMHNRLREILGVEVRWESRYEGEVGTVAAVANPYFNYEGCAHYSRSERQRRRVAQRARAARLDRCEELEAAVKRYFKGFFAIVENPDLLGETPSGKGAAPGKPGDDLQFCALTELKTQNKPSCPEPKRTIVENLCPNRAGRGVLHHLKALLSSLLRAKANRNGTEVRGNPNEPESQQPH